MLGVETSAVNAFGASETPRCILSAAVVRRVSDGRTGREQGAPGRFGS
jgi:hypothetical protein